MKYDALSRLDIARTIWNVFIADVRKLKVHYGRRHIMIVVELKEDVDSENVVEANMLDRNTYQELNNIPVQRNG